MGTICQGFFGDCPKVNNQEYNWWNHVKQHIPQLKQDGFTALWLPPACKAQDVVSMGYNPMDYFDLGEFKQRYHNREETWFGSKKDLCELICEAHKYGIQVLADLVINHSSGGEEELNPYTNEMGYTKFSPASEKFQRNYECFHPSKYETFDGYTFEGYSETDLCHRNPCVYKEILEYCRWLIEEIGFDGFRFDCVKGYGGWLIKSIQEYKYIKNQKIFGIGELWEDKYNQTIENWLNEVNNYNDNPVSAFDFGLRAKLRRLCLEKQFSLRELANWNNTLLNRPFECVTFVENHDTCTPHPDIDNKEIFTDKMLAYSFILTHQGYPCIFWQDYFNFGLAQNGYKSGISALVKLHEEYAGGKSDILYVDDNLYILQRRGYQSQKGLIYVLNNREDGWNGKCIQTQWRNTNFVSKAWRGENNLDMPQSISTNNECYGEFWAPPRGYAVYVPNI